MEDKPRSRKFKGFEVIVELVEPTEEETLELARCLMDMVRRFEQAEAAKRADPGASYRPPQ